MRALLCSEYRREADQEFRTMLLLQAVYQVAGWVGPTIAISLVIIALAFATIALVALLVGRGLGAAVQRSTESINKLNADLIPAMKSLGQMAEDGRALAEIIRNEVGDFTGTTQRLRDRIESGSDRLAQRLDNLEALYDVVEEEITEAALDLTATIRTIRTGAGWFGRIRRLLGGKRRRR
jgi:methyl-accepting chemotaxis protein